MINLSSCDCKTKFDTSKLDEDTCKPNQLNIVDTDKLEENWNEQK